MADFIWQPKAAPKRDRIKVAFGGTPASSDTISAKFGPSGAFTGFTMTLGSTDITAADVAEKFATLYNATQRSAVAAATIDDTTFDGVGGEVPQLSELTATIDAADTTIVWLLANAADKEHLVTVTKTGDVTVTVTHDGTGGSIVSTGPSFWSNADNWVGGSVPSAGDNNVIFDGAYSNWPCRYGLPASGDGLDVNLYVRASYQENRSFGGEIGLPPINRSGATPYQEYRNRRLVLDGSTGPDPAFVVIGEGPGDGPARCNLRVEDVGDWYLTVHSSATKAPLDELFAVNVSVNVAPINMNQTFGLVCLDTDAGDTAVALGNITVGTTDSTLSNTRLKIGSNFTMASKAVNQRGGHVEWRAANGTASTLLVVNGEFHAHDTTPKTITIGEKGIVLPYVNIGTIALVDIREKGILDNRRGTFDNWTATDVDMYKAAALLDPQRFITHSNAIKLRGCGVNDVVIDKGDHVAVTVAAI